MTNLRLSPVLHESGTDWDPWPRRPGSAAELPRTLQTMDFVLLCVIAVLGLLLLSVPLWG